MDTVEIIKIEDFEICFQWLRYAYLENSDKKIRPYLNAKISTRKFETKDVLPTSYYALNDHLNYLVNLESKFSDKNLSIFNLPGIVYYRCDGIIKAIAPPFVEIYPENCFGNEDILVKSLQDGVHRFLLAKRMSINQKCILIDNKMADTNYLPYAIPNNWDEVVIYNKVPKIKKNYRREDNYSYMRPLSALFDKSIVSSWSDYGRT